MEANVVWWNRFIKIQYLLTFQSKASHTSFTFLVNYNFKVSLKSVFHVMAVSASGMLSAGIFVHHLLIWGTTPGCKKEIRQLAINFCQGSHYKFHIDPQKKQKSWTLEYWFLLWLSHSLTQRVEKIKRASSALR